MRELPSGTVTFLFTDVEGSTRLLEELGTTAYAALLAEHHHVCRQAWVAHGGLEVDTAGDAFFVVFERPSDALEAAQAAQQALVEMGVGVRMGVHTGEVALTETGYVGIEVHRAARIAAAGHGGQVLVSAATIDLVDIAGMRDLGEHRFKDLAAAERIYQLGDGEFPPLKSLYRVTLPVPQTAFLGREEEVGEVAALLARADARLVSLTGPGGTGKTRLALQAAAETSGNYPDGVFWVGLAPLRDATLALSTLAQALGVPEQAERSLLETLAERAGGKRLLVVLDNAEHLLPILAAELTALRAAAPTLTLLVTSRERLQLQGELVYAVPSLSEPESMELFLARAAALGAPVARSAAAAELCRRLDHLPLAVELAAARTVLFSAEQLLERLSERLDLLRGGRDADPRQQALRATIDWSHDLLDESEKQLFRRLSVFVGGCTYAAAERVADTDPDTLQSLLDKSLIRRGDEDEPRYWMLETVREYATERLHHSGEADEVRRMHGDWCIAVAEEAAATLDRNAGADDRVAALDRLELEYDNCRTALSWATELAEVELGLRLGGSLVRYWVGRGNFTEARAWLESLVAGAGGVASPSLVDCLSGAGWLAVEQGELELGHRHLEQGLSLARHLGDLRREAVMLSLLGAVAGFSGDNAGAISLLHESVKLNRSIGDSSGAALALNNLGCTLLDLGELEPAATALDESLAIAREEGDAQLLAIVLNSAGAIAVHRGALDEARDLHEESLALAQQLGDQRGVAWALKSLAEVHAARGDPERAVRLWGASDRINGEIGRNETMTPVERAKREEALLDLRARLGEPAFDVALDEGRELDLDRAVAYALDVSAPPVNRHAAPR